MERDTPVSPRTALSSLWEISGVVENPDTIQTIQDCLENGYKAEIYGDPIVYSGERVGACYTFFVRFRDPESRAEAQMEGQSWEIYWFFLFFYHLSPQVQVRAFT